MGGRAIPLTLPPSLHSLVPGNMEEGVASPGCPRESGMEEGGSYPFHGGECASPGGMEESGPTPLASEVSRLPEVLGEQCILAILLSAGYPPLASPAMNGDVVWSPSSHSSHFPECRGREGEISL